MVYFRTKEIAEVDGNVEVAVDSLVVFLIQDDELARVLEPVDVLPQPTTQKP